MPKFQDLTGQKYGHLTAIRYLGSNKWVWRCDCGSEKDVLAASVKRGVTQSCSVSCPYSTSHNLTKDLSGKRFGRLLVIERTNRYKTASGKRGTYYRCKCDCGNEVTVIAGHLTTGHTWSCGCAHAEQMEAWKTINLKHGKTNNRRIEKSYQTWEYIKRRCYNPADIDYPYYGAKGIVMWEGWVNNPADFCEYVETLERYNEKGTTIDRIDYTKNYEPGNIRWLSLAEQQRNKSSNRRITVNGETHILQEWANITGLSYGVISYRLKHGWTPEEAISVPASYGNRIHKNPNGNGGTNNEKVACKTA